MGTNGEIPSSDILLIRMRNKYNSLSNAARKVAAYMLEEHEDAMYLSITQLAERSGVSEGTITKFSRTMGFDSFQQMKISLALEKKASNQDSNSYTGDIRIEDSLDEICSSVFMNNVESLRDTLKIIDVKKIKTAASKVLAAKKVDIYGSGASSVSALYAHLRFYRIGINSNDYSDSHKQIISASLLGKRGVALGISNSGQSFDVVNALECARESGATTICITSSDDSPIVKHSDIVLFSSSRDSAKLNESLCAPAVQLALIDAIYAAVISMKPDTFIQNLAKSSDAIKCLRTMPYAK